MASIDLFGGGQQQPDTPSNSLGGGFPGLNQPTIARPAPGAVVAGPGAGPVPMAPPPRYGGGPTGIAQTPILPQPVSNWQPTPGQASMDTNRWYGDRQAPVQEGYMPYGGYDNRSYAATSPEIVKAQTGNAVRGDATGTPEGVGATPKTDDSVFKPANDGTTNARPEGTPEAAEAERKKKLGVSTGTPVPTAWTNR